jgi:hypothetical protein
MYISSLRASTRLGLNGRLRPVIHLRFRAFATMAEETTAPAAIVPEGAAKAKIRGRAFYESIGSPKYIVAPMVDQSEFVSLSARRL